MAWTGMEWHGMAWTGMDWHGVAWNSMEWHGMALASMYLVLSFFRELTQPFELSALLMADLAPLAIVCVALLLGLRVSLLPVGIRGR